MSLKDEVVLLVVCANEAEYNIITKSLGEYQPLATTE